MDDTISQYSQKFEIKQEKSARKKFSKIEKSDKEESPIYEEVEMASNTHDNAGHAALNDKRKLNAVSYQVLLKEEPQYETPIHNQPAACKVDDLLPDSGYTELQRTNEDEIKSDYQKLIHRGEGHLVSSDRRKELYDDIKSTVNIPTWVQQGR